MELTLHRPPPSKLCLAHHFLQYDLRQLGNRFKRRLTGQQVKYIAENKYAMPDSELSQKALAFTRECSPDFLLNHCLRSHAFAVALAAEMKLRFDPEILFIGSILHDLGLTERCADNDTFELSGARAARSFCQTTGMDSQQSDLIHEMVALHNAIGIADTREAEIALLHFGAGADVIGLHLKDIHPRTLREIISRYPRENFSEAMAELIQKQIEQKPKSYMSTMVRMGFLNKMQALSLD